jgi:hypothetical protein
MHGTAGGYGAPDASWRAQCIVRVVWRLLDLPGHCHCRPVQLGCRAWCATHGLEAPGLASRATVRAEICRQCRKMNCRRTATDGRDGIARTRKHAADAAATLAVGCPHAQLHALTILQHGWAGSLKVPDHRLASAPDMWECGHVSRSGASNVPFLPYSETSGLTHAGTSRCSRGNPHGLHTGMHASGSMLGPWPLDAESCAWSRQPQRTAAGAAVLWLYSTRAAGAGSVCHQEVF